MMFDNDEKTGLSGGTKGRTNAGRGAAFDNELAGAPGAGDRLQEVLPPLALLITFVMVFLGMHGADPMVLVIAGAPLVAVVAIFVALRVRGGQAR